MNKNLLNVSIFCLGLSTLTSCKKSILEAGTTPNANTVMSINTNTGADGCFDWQNLTSVSLTNGEKRTLPWYNGATTQIPNFILEDYKKEDGWEMLYNLLNSTENGQNYLVFYNKFTGVIRNYYFLADNIGEGNNGMWGLGMSNDNSLLNNTGYFAKPIDEPSRDPLATSTNISISGATKSVSRGWNAFDTEVTFDPNAANKTVKMRMLSYNTNISQVNLTGDISLSSDGTIVSMGSKNGAQDIANSAAKLSGAGAKSWITDKLTKESDKGKAVIKLLKGSLADIASGGVTKLVGAGINLLFGSFIGRQGQETSTTQKLEFKTNGTLSLNGTISFNSANNVSSVANLYTPGTQLTSDNFLLPCYNKKLGVWNLQTSPVVYTSRTIYLGGESNGSGIYSRGYDLDRNSVKVVMNPDLLPEIESYEVKSDLLYYSVFHNKKDWQEAGNDQGFYGGTLLYDDKENVFYDGGIYEQFNGPGMPPPTGNPNQEVDLPTIDVDYINKKFVVKVTVTIKPKAGYNQEPIVITRSYIPTYKLF